MERQYNLRSPAVKRLMKEAQELHEATEIYYAQPLEDNLFEWHFTLRGPGDTEFDGGIYHGRICLPPEYPMKPPSIMLLTPNGRFETYKKICLSISGHHPESWQPSWSIRTALLAIIGFMPTHGNGAIGALDYKPEERKKLAKASLDWKCPDCGCLKDKLKPLTEASKSDAKEAKELAAQINFQAENKNAKSSASTTSTSTAPAPSTAATSPSSPASSSTSSAQPAPPIPPVPPPAMPGMPPFPMFPMMPPTMFPPGSMSGMRPPGGGMPPMMPPNPMMMMMMMRAQAMNMAMATAAAQRTGAPLPPGPFGMPGMMPGFGMMPPGMGMMPGMMPGGMPGGMPRTGVPPSTSSAGGATGAPAASSASPVTENIGPAAAPPPAASVATPTPMTPTSTTPPASSSANTPSQTTTPTPTPAPSAPTPAPSTTSPAQPSLRQRRPVPAAPTQAFGSAELPRQPVSRRSSPLILAVMILLGISIVMLLARRLLNVNVWRFDTDF